MPRKPRKVSAKVGKKLLQSSRVLQPEAKPSWNLEFKPLPSAMAAAKQKPHFWRTRLGGDPRRHPQFVERAIRRLEINLHVDHWEMVAVDYKIHPPVLP